MYKAQRELVYGDDGKRGVIGEYTGFNFKNHRLHVGDLLVYDLERGNTQTGIVIKCEGTYVIMGAVKIPLHNSNILKKVIGYKLLTEEIAHDLHRIAIKEVPRKMTLEQIVEELGYKVEIVDSCE